MPNDRFSAEPARADHPSNPIQSWETPRVDVIALDCEITAYAPDGDGPLF
jgi:hypothetical protein